MELVAILLIVVVSVKLDSQKCVERNRLGRFVHTKLFRPTLWYYPVNKSTSFLKGLCSMYFVANFALERPQLSVRGQSIRFATWDISEAEGFYLPDPKTCNCSSEYRSSLGKPSHRLSPACSKISPDQGNLSKVTEWS